MSQNSILRIVVLRIRGFLRKMYVHFYNSDRKKATCSFTVCKLLNFTLSDFWQKFREIETLNWFHGFFFFSSENILFVFTTPQCGKPWNSLSPKNISSNQLFSEFISKTLLSRNFCKRSVRVNFRNFHTVNTLLPTSSRKMRRNLILTGIVRFIGKFLSKVVLTTFVDFWSIIAS